MSCFAPMWSYMGVREAPGEDNRPAAATSQPCQPTIFHEQQAGETEPCRFTPSSSSPVGVNTLLCCVLSVLACIAVKDGFMVAPLRLVMLIGMGLVALAAWFSFKSRTRSPRDDRPIVPANRNLEAQFVAAGVPPEKSAKVASLAVRLGASGVEQLSDPLTLMRFLTAREEDVDAAAIMYNETCAWRASYSINLLMYKHGAGEVYASDGSRLGEAMSWQWGRTADSVDATLASKYVFFKRLAAAAPDGGPIALWQVPDLDGIKREGMEKVLRDAFVTHMEDLLQAGRSESIKQKKMVRARIIIDAHGVSTAVLRHRAVFVPMMQMIKKYFPEVSASVSIIRAPWIFSTIFQAVSPLLTPVMKQKVCIMGQTFQSKLQEHSTVSVACLPTFLGGCAGSCTGEIGSASNMSDELDVASSMLLEEATSVASCWLRKVKSFRHKMEVPACCLR